MRIVYIKLSIENFRELHLVRWILFMRSTCFLHVVLHGFLHAFFAPSNPAVPNLWVATPRGVVIDFHWGRHWSSDILKNPCTIAHPQWSLNVVSVNNCALSELITYIYCIVLYIQIAISYLNFCFNKTILQKKHLATLEKKFCFF